MRVSSSGSCYGVSTVAHLKGLRSLPLQISALIGEGAGCVFGISFCLNMQN